MGTWKKENKAGKTLDRKENSNSVLYPHNLVLGQHLLDLSNRLTGVQTLGAGSCAVENGVAAVHAHAVVKRGLALGCALVTRIGEPAVGLKEDGGSEVLLAVPPI